MVAFSDPFADIANNPPANLWEQGLDENYSDRLYQLDSQDFFSFHEDLAAPSTSHLPSNSVGSPGSSSRSPGLEQSCTHPPAREPSLFEVEDRRDAEHYLYYPEIIPSVLENPPHRPTSADTSSLACNYQSSPVAAEHRTPSEPPLSIIKRLGRKPSVSTPTPAEPRKKKHRRTTSGIGSAIKNFLHIKSASGSDISFTDCDTKKGSTPHGLLNRWKKHRSESAARRQMVAEIRFGGWSLFHISFLLLKIACVAYDRGSLT